jgi:hypothetical protein
MAIRDQEMVARAFAGEDVVGDFEDEKTAIAEEEDDKVIDNTLPGWGSWVGDGVSAKEKKRHQGRFLTKVDGIKKKDRKDAKLDKVIINEKRIKKVNKLTFTPRLYNMLTTSRTTVISHLSSLTPSSPANSTSARCVYLLDQSGRRRRPSRTAPSLVCS